MPTDPKDPAVKEASEKRKEDAGKDDVPATGTILDLGEKDAKGVGAGK